MTNSGRVIVLLLFLSRVIQGNEGQVIIGEMIRCNGGIEYTRYDHLPDEVLTTLGQRVDEHRGPGFNTYYSTSWGGHSYHGHACCHPTLFDQYCSRCIHYALDEMRLHCKSRIGAFLSLKDTASNFACEVRYETYDVDDDYFSCARY